MSGTLTATDRADICAFSLISNQADESELKIRSFKSRIQNLEDSARELEMVLDEEEPIKFRIGPSFYEIPLEDAQKRVAEEITSLKEELKAETGRKAQFDGQIEELKKRLYGKFGDEIMLEMSSP